MKRFAVAIIALIACTGHALRIQRMSAVDCSGTELVRNNWIGALFGTIGCCALAFYSMPGSVVQILTGINSESAGKLACSICLGECCGAGASQCGKDALKRCKGKSDENADGVEAVVIAQPGTAMVVADQPGTATGMVPAASLTRPASQG